MSLEQTLFKLTELKLKRYSVDVVVNVDCSKSIKCQNKQIKMICVIFETDFEFSSLHIHIYIYMSCITVLHIFPLS